jgi:hypothetical protein
VEKDRELVEIEITRSGSGSIKMLEAPDPEVTGPGSLFFFVSPVALRNRNIYPGPFRHPVDYFFVFLPYRLATFCQTFQTVKKVSLLTNNM